MIESISRGYLIKISRIKNEKYLVIYKNDKYPKLEILNTDEQQTEARASVC